MFPKMLLHHGIHKMLPLTVSSDRMTWTFTLQLGIGDRGVEIDPHITNTARLLSGPLQTVSTQQ